MTRPTSIAISGDLGGGKTTVSSILAEVLGLRRISMGQLYRMMAQDRGLSAVQMNLHSERDEAIDDYIDKIQTDLASSGEPLVVDSRLAWHFFPDAFKVHLIVDPAVAAERVMLRPQSDVETYTSIEEAIDRLQIRNQSERLRFLKKYGIDKARLRNYDLVCDTTHAQPEHVAKRIQAAFAAARDGISVHIGSSPLLLLDPQRIYPSQDIRYLRGMWESKAIEGLRQVEESTIAPILVAYTGQNFCVVDGHRRLSTALRKAFPFIQAELLAEDGERLAMGLTAKQYFEGEVTLSTIADWEAAHNIQLGFPPHLLAAVGADSA